MRAPMSSTNATLAVTLHEVLEELAKVSRPAHRKEGQHFACLQQLKRIAHVLEGNFNIRTPEPTPEPKPKRKLEAGPIVVKGGVIYAEHRFRRGAAK